MSIDFGDLRFSKLLASKRLHAFFFVVTLLLAAIGPYPEVHGLSAWHKAVFWPAVVAFSIAGYLGSIRILDLIGIDSFWEPILVAALVVPLTVVSVYFAEMAVGLPIPPASRFATLMAVNLFIVGAISHFFAYFVLSDIDLSKVDFRPHQRFCRLNRQVDNQFKLAHAPSQSLEKWFTWKSARAAYSDLIRMHADRQYVSIYTRHSHFYVRGSFSEALGMLPADFGMQIHRSHWVHVEQIRRLVKTRSGFQVELHCGTKLPVARSRVNDIKRIIHEHI